MGPCELCNLDPRGDYRLCRKDGTNHQNLTNSCKLPFLAMDTLLKILAVKNCLKHN